MSALIVRKIVARVLEVVGVLVIAAALFLWIPLVALGFVGLSVVVLAQSVDGGK